MHFPLVFRFMEIGKGFGVTDQNQIAPLCITTVFLVSGDIVRWLMMLFDHICSSSSLKSHAGYCTLAFSLAIASSGSATGFAQIWLCNALLTSGTRIVGNADECGVDNKSVLNVSITVKFTSHILMEQRSQLEGIVGVLLTSKSTFFVNWWAWRSLACRAPVSGDEVCSTHSVFQS